MSVDDARTAISPPIPSPRTPESAPEAWRPAGGTHPRTEYWDVATASWRPCGPPADQGD